MRLPRSTGTGPTDNARTALGRRWSSSLGNGHHANGIGNSPAPVNGNGNGRTTNEAMEPQQSLFSWAEFMAEEPVKPRRRGRKPQPATLSMFEWAISLEQEREAELVGAGR